jgi:hypothetical protein
VTFFVVLNEEVFLVLPPPDMQPTISEIDRISSTQDDLGGGVLWARIMKVLATGISGASSNCTQRT